MLLQPSLQTVTDRVRYLDEVASFASQKCAVADRQQSRRQEEFLAREAKTRGVDADRLVFAPRQPLAQHLARHRRADLFLDTLPYNAHTTASDALWAGLPVLTCVGDAFAGRVAASLLNAIGLPELVTHSLEEYEALALRLATDSMQLQELRHKLAVNRSTTPLFDTSRHTRHLEAAYLRMWDSWTLGKPVEAFAVAPMTNHRDG